VISSCPSKKDRRNQGHSPNLREEAHRNSTRPDAPLGERGPSTAFDIQESEDSGSRLTAKQLPDARASLNCHVSRAQSGVLIGSSCVNVRLVSSLLQSRDSFHPRVVVSNNQSSVNLKGWLQDPKCPLQPLSEIDSPEIDGGGVRELATCDSTCIPRESFPTHRRSRVRLLTPGHGSGRLQAVHRDPCRESCDADQRGTTQFAARGAGDRLVSDTP